MKLHKFLPFLYCILHAQFVCAQFAGSLDEFLRREAPGTRVTTFGLQKDHKVLLGGFFNEYDGQISRSIARINPNGTLDTGFSPGDGVSGIISDFEVQADGKILICGDFNAYDGTPRNDIARLNEDGTLDTSFNPGDLFTPEITNFYHIDRVHQQQDGKILFAGTFIFKSDTILRQVVRVLEDGTLDPSFMPGKGNPQGLPFFREIATQADGKIILAGSIDEYNGSPVANIMRLLPDGSIDNTFTPGGSTDEPILSLEIDQTDRILISGNFTSFDGVARNGIARLTSEGLLDTSFDPGDGPNQGVTKVVNSEDGKIYIVGFFTDYAGTSRNRVARLFEDGTLDASFDPGNGADDWVNSLVIADDRSIFLSGFFTTYDDVPVQNSFIRINADGSIADQGANGRVFSIQALPDDKIIITGEFTAYNGIPRNAIARLLADGSLDETFDPGSGADALIFPSALQEDQKILIGGFFTRFDGVARNAIARLLANGSLDETFDPGVGANGLVTTIYVQPDQKILVGGFFTEFNNQPTPYLLRLNPDGSRDDSFAPVSGPNFLVRSLFMTQDQKIYVAGDFTTYDGVARNGIARLHNNGTLDETFDPGAGADGSVRTISIQENEKILIGGEFNFYDGVPASKLARLNSNGALDFTFNNGSFSRIVRIRSISIQSDQKLLIGGEFDFFDGRFINHLARLNPDGTLDETFLPGLGSGPNGDLWDTHIRPDGRAILAGNFTTYNTTPRDNIARAFCAVPQTPRGLNISLSNDSSFVLSWTKVAGVNVYEIDVSQSRIFENFLEGFQRKVIRDTTTIITGLQAGEVYYCRVRALNEQGASPNSIIVTQVIPPVTPEGFRVMGVGRDQIALEWDFREGHLYKIEFTEDTSSVYQDLVLVTRE